MSKKDENKNEREQKEKTTTKSKWKQKQQQKILSCASDLRETLQYVKYINTLSSKIKDYLYLNKQNQECEINEIK